MISVALVVVLFSSALAIGVYAFDNRESQKTETAEITTLKPIDAKQIQKSENIITKLGTSPVDEAIAKTYANKKAEEKRLAIKKVKEKAEAKRLAAKKAKEKAEAKKAEAMKAENDNDTNETESKAGFKKLGTFSATAYCGCASCCGTAGGHTASGTTPKAGRTIATDPSVIPLGSKVMIDGHVYVAEDTGGAIGGQRVDIFFDSHSEALQFGRRSVEVSIKK